jgi:outer membrane protein W
MNRTFVLGLATVAASLAPSLAAADELAEKPRKRFYVRAGVVHIAPLEQSDEMELANIDGPASLSVQNGPIAGSGATISSATIPGMIIGYVLPFGGDKLSVETIVGLPFTVTFQATGTLANESIAPDALGIPTGIGPLGPELGEAKALPIVLTAIYRVAKLGKIEPYVGAGPTIMFATEEKVTNAMLTEISQPSMSIAPSPGLVLQTGIDANITSRIYARLDFKFIAFMKARATVDHVQVRTPDLPLFDTVEVGTAKMSMWVNPFIIQAGIGTDFW